MGTKQEKSPDFNYKWYFTSQEAFNAIVEQYANNILWNDKSFNDVDFNKNSIMFTEVDFMNAVKKVINDKLKEINYDKKNKSVSRT